MITATIPVQMATIETAAARDSKIPRALPALVALLAPLAW